MKRTILNILITSAVIMAAVSCNKEQRPDRNSTDYPIEFCATEAGATKAMLDEETFAKAGNLIKIYDYYTPAGETSPETTPYIDDQIKSNGPGNLIWPFVNQRYNWTPDGSHKFFGWLAEDVNMISATDAAANTPAEFFGSDFGFNTTSQVLTIPSKSMQKGVPQFDFMYSDIYERNLTTNPDYGSHVPLEFSHLFTAFNVTAQNKSTNTIVLKSVTLTDLKDTKSATINYTAATGTTGSTAATVTYADAATSGDSFIFTNTGLTLTSTAQAIADYHLLWPQTDAELDDAKVTLVYDYTEKATGVTTPNVSRIISLSSLTEWKAGTKNNINLVFKDKEIILQCIVMDWIPQEEIIDFSDQVTVDVPITWDESTVRSVNYETGEVILFDDTAIEATCHFKFTSPKGATWTASLIPIEGHQDAFEFFGSTKYGAVGVDTPVQLRVTNQAPIAPRHVCYLRITIQTADGRTIVVKNMIAGKDNQEFKVIQNLING